jgi:hypothetical protein
MRSLSLLATIFVLINHVGAQEIRDIVRHAPCIPDSGTPTDNSLSVGDDVGSFEIIYAPLTSRTYSIHVIQRQWQHD